MIAVFIAGFVVVFGLAVYDEHYHSKKRSDKAKRAQARIVEARKGYKNLNPISKQVDRPY
jgi:hypothetical protein